MTTYPRSGVSSDTAQAALRSLTAREMRLAIGNTPAPLEQLEPWEAFERTQGRTLFGRYAYIVDGKPVAVIALYRYQVAGFTFLWAKHGPVWLKEQTPQRERELRRLLVREVRRRDNRVVFLRLHARFRAPDTRELMSSITYDRTFVIDLRPGDPEAIRAAMPKDGRRGVRRAERVAREAGCQLAEETGLDRAQFEDLYAVLVATAKRDGFRPHPSQTYWDMLTSLGPSHARVFVLRRDGVPHCWDIVTVSGKQATAYYGASSNESRTFRGAEALDWFVACQLAAEGMTGLDLMGAESSRVPELYTVGRYKRRFASHPTEVDGAWDIPVHPLVYRTLVQARRARHLVRDRLGM
ncbi:lipid II:glycine glycyltransferase FemX [Actinomyces sp. MRS3W]|uniref:lipid II:glycine glycyltransferase FemX n=1 Tax=Actinomyces sp. MRS3W TaxID=2800796 RepID=UPI0028FDABF1|nr:GNAT family N-acetyltransferase [Actinomyces sp. MRS3W]MDU0347605.1 GNAT family N-acetyltransferase [Actinomyces sp. MRS3W]